MRGVLRKRLLSLALLVAPIAVALSLGVRAVSQEAARPESRQVQIIRDEFGEPHVFGSSAESVWYGVGYAVGQDRLWRADLLQRTGNGSSAEYLGAGALEGDVFARTLFGPENVIAPGQSGNAFDPHFDDQLDLYAAWTYKPMRLDRRSLLGNTESVVTLTP